MLNEFLLKYQDEVVRRCKARVALRTPGAPPAIEYGIAEFIRQVIAALQIEHSRHPQDNLSLVGEPGGAEMRSEVGTAAAMHGKDLLMMGVEVEEVVHHYGDVCQVITSLMQELGEEIGIDEYRTLNRCLDSAIAHAVTEFSYHHDLSTARESALLTNARTAEFLQELRKLLGTASLAFSAARSGSLSVSGATGAVLERTLQQMGKLIENFAEDLHGIQLADLDVFSVAELIDEVCTTATPAAQAQGATLTALPVDRELGLRGNRDSVFAALINLLQSAFDAARPGVQVTLAAYASGDHIRIDIMDNCCDAPAESEAAGSQRSELGLALAKRFVAANDGVLMTRKLPGAGRMFAVSLPRYAMPS
jgi:signal transduction histidine kinase